MILTATLLSGAISVMPATTAVMQENTVNPQQASYIPMSAANDKADDFAQFLSDAAPLVRKTEPGTLLWFALHASPGNDFAIFDTFRDEDARDAHFTGAVAEALNANAASLVAGGWENGVVANINNGDVLSAIHPVNAEAATTATYISLQAAPGQEDALAALLTQAGSVVAETEPATLYWVSLRLDHQRFAIFDIFADDAGREAHFAGKVAGLLKEKSSTLVESGWENGVVANVRNYRILAMK